MWRHRNGRAFNQLSRLVERHKLDSDRQMKSVIDIIECVSIYRFVDDITAFETVLFTAGARIDCDGSGGNPDHDPYFQDDTTLHGPDGKALNAYKTPFIVVPPVVCKRTKGIVLGATALVKNVFNNHTCVAVVGDIGPRHKIGEMSPACAVALGLDGNPNHGGTSSKCIEYEIQVGKPAEVNGVQYKLRPYGG